MKEQTYTQTEVIALITKFARDAQKAIVIGLYQLPTQTVKDWVKWNIENSPTDTTKPIVNTQNLTNETENFKVFRVD